jgi:hypothetical protein
MIRSRDFVENQFNSRGLKRQAFTCSGRTNSRQMGNRGPAGDLEETRAAAAQHKMVS